VEGSHQNKVVGQTQVVGKAEGSAVSVLANVIAALVHGEATKARCRRPAVVDQLAELVLEPVEQPQAGEQQRVINFILLLFNIVFIQGNEKNWRYSSLWRFI
jgi:hypothetical protein